MIELQGDWPDHLIVPSEAQFTHEGKWVEFNSDKERDHNVSMRLCLASHYAASGTLESEERREALKFHCGTTCCLVGWAALAFGESGCKPGQINNPATIQFLRKFMELAGHYVHPIITSSESVSWEASNLYEGEYTEKWITPRRARNLWKKTGEHFNYDVGNLLE